MLCGVIRFSLASACLVVCVFAALTSVAEEAPRRSYEVPRIDQIKRVDAQGRARLARSLLGQALYIHQTEEHPVKGLAYVVVTDHVDEAYLKPLRRLLEFRKGRLLVYQDLGDLIENDRARGKLRADLKAADARFVALAPRKKSFRENVVLAFLDVASSLDEDAELDVFPGWLIAGDAESFVRLIDQTIAFRSSGVKELKPFTLCQVSAKEIRSQQKACIMDDYFEKLGIKMPSLSVRIRAPAITREIRSAVGDPDDWVIGAMGGGRLLPGLPSQSEAALEQASLMMIYGHGAPGRICALSLDAFQEVDFSGKMVLCGACFSALPEKSDFPLLQRGPGGGRVNHQAGRFADRMVSQGAVAVLAHMRLSDGFPSVFPVFESMMQGLSVGESAQRLLNAAILRVNLPRGQFCLKPSQRGQASAQGRRNALLWIMIGDPALRLVKVAE